jgi:DNA-binding LacI/PurR family transcriptional regulator
VTIEVLALLVRRIAVGQWPEGARLPPSRQLAAECCAAHKTLLRALHLAAKLELIDLRPRRPTTVSTGAAARAARLLGPAAGAAKRRIALLLPDEAFPLRNPFYVSLIESLVSEAARHGLEAALVRWHWREQLVQAQAFAAEGFVGAICLGLTGNYNMSLLRLQELAFPTVLFNRQFPGLRLPTVRVDASSGFRQLVDTLMSHGHRNLSFVSHFAAEPTAGDRDPANVWMRILEERGLLKSCRTPLLVLPWLPGLQRHARLFSGLLTGPQSPTAVVLMHSLWLRKFLREVGAARRRIPRDLSLALVSGGDRVPWVSRSGPAVTTLEIDHHRAAECLLEVLRQALSGACQPTVVRLQQTLHVTDSLGPAPPRS